ncbi:MAG: hypothetical protein V4754_02095 [Pseudomonadota bacterium]
MRWRRFEYHTGNHRAAGHHGHAASDGNRSSAGCAGHTWRDANANADYAYAVSCPNANPNANPNPNANTGPDATTDAYAHTPAGLQLRGGDPYHRHRQRGQAV